VTGAEAKADTDPLRTLEDATLEGPAGVSSCDLCFVNLTSPEAQYSIVEQRAVCIPCIERWHEEYPELPSAQQVNLTIGLVARGYFAGGRADPGPNHGLGGRP